MKVALKPISSPGRIEKFPPPLMMRFLTSNVGSKSRGRSRSSPMFVRKKNAVIETQEPSSPKVTCIGQVRVRRSSKHFSGSNSGRSRTLLAKCPSFRLPKNLFCNPRKPKLGSFRSVWRKWVSFFRFGYCKKVNVRDDSSKVESNRRIHYKDSETGENDDEEGHGELVPDVFISSTPPKNAFLLTRCRSAPYRSSSSLACRFLGSDQGNSETEEDGSEAKERCDFEVGERDLEGPKRLLSEPNSRKLVAGSRTDQESVDILAIRKHFECFINGRNSEADYTQRNATLPLILTRCKSEPAKTGERLINPEKRLLSEPNSRKLVAGSRTDQESVDILAIRKHFECFINGRNSEADYTQRNATLPLILTRCKSEPAKTGERLINPENHLFLEPNKVEFC